MKHRRGLRLIATSVMLIVLSTLAPGIAQRGSATFTPTTFVYLPYIESDILPTLAPAPTLTPTSTPPTQSDVSIVTLSGTSTPEYVIIHNSGTVSQNMTGWTLVSVIGPQTFNFPNGYTLAPGTSVRIESYTGAGNNPPSILFWTNAAIWNNSGDKAELRNASNQVISSACYGNACP